MPAILGEMELAGVRVDRAVLARLSGEFAQSLARFEDEIYALAGQRFNIGSTIAGRGFAVRQVRPAGREEDLDGQMEHWREGAGRFGCERGVDGRSAAAARRSCSNGASSPSSRAPTPTLCPSISTRKRAASILPMRWLRPRPAGCPRPSRICRTSRSAPRKAGKSAPPSSRSRARSSSPPITARSSCACSRIWRTSPS